MKKAIERSDYGHIIIKTRHSVLVCKLTDAHDHSCKCAKQLFVHQKGQPIQRVSAGTNDFISARARAREIVESWTPAARELAGMKAKNRREHTPIAEAITDFLNDFKRRHKDPTAETEAKRNGINSTYLQYRLLLEKHLMNWIVTYNAARPEVDHLKAITDLTTDILLKWTGSWTWGDLTCAQRLVVAKIFFIWLHNAGKIPSNPAKAVARPKQVARGNRTSVFTDDQYNDIIKAIPDTVPPNVPLKTQTNWAARLLVFVELMRWTGMALVDAVLFNPNWIEEDGTLTYDRHKTGVTATIPLASIAPHMLRLLRNIPLEEDSVGPDQPFRTKGVKLESDTHKWGYERLGDLFRLAGIKRVENNIHRMRKPHPHMLRDTFASYCLNDLDLELPDVAKMLGHSSSKVTEASYWPWVRKRSDALARRVREARTGFLRRQRQSGKLVSIAQERLVAVN